MCDILPKIQLKHKRFLTQLSSQNQQCKHTSILTVGLIWFKRHTHLINNVTSRASFGRASFSRASFRFSELNNSSCGTADFRYIFSDG